MTDHLPALLDYIRMCAVLHERGGIPDGLTSPMRFLLEHGRAFPVTERTYKGRRGTPKQCYMNAGNLACTSRGLTYAEGFVTLPRYGIPIPHAFLVDDQGGAVDPTLRRDDQGDRVYFGLLFTETYLRRSILASGYWGLLCDFGPALQDIAHGRTEGMLADLDKADAA